MIQLAALLLGVVAGLRTMIPLAGVSWVATSGALPVGGTWLAFLGHPSVAIIFSLAAFVELVTDQSPRTPSRKVPVQLTARVVSGALSGAAVGTAAGDWRIGLLAGALGAVAGTYGGAEGRQRLAERFGKDRPAALLEDAAAIGGAALILALLT